MCRLVLRQVGRCASTRVMTRPKFFPRQLTCTTLPVRARSASKDTGVHMAKNKVAFIGKGNVVKALARGLERAGHEVRLVGKDGSDQ